MSAGTARIDVFPLAEGLDLEAQLLQQRSVLLQQLPVPRVGPQGHRGQQGLGHDLPVLRLQPVEVHALVGGVLVDEQQLIPQLHQDIGLQGLPQYLVVGDGGLSTF